MVITVEHPILMGTISVPRSKSLLQRHLALRALHGLPLLEVGPTDAEDVRVMASLLSQRDNPVWHCGESGTCARFAIVLATQATQPVEITGAENLKMRPMGPLLEALGQLGVQWEYRGQPGCLPVYIIPRQLSGGTVKLDPSQSSQFLSALMLLGTRLPEGLEIHLTNEPVSWSYVQMTAAVLESYQFSYELPASPEEEPVVRVWHREAVTPEELNIEGDWSALAFWYEAAALAQEAELLFPNVPAISVQGDAVLSEYFDVLGVATDYYGDGVRVRKAGPPETEFLEAFLGDTPDLFPALAVTCAGLGIEAEFQGLNHLAFKESHRPQALAQELARLEAHLHWDGDTAHLKPPLAPPTMPMRFNPHNDHRLAMALAPLALKWHTIYLEHPEVVQKSYPQFWEHWDQCVVDGKRHEEES